MLFRREQEQICTRYRDTERPNPSHSPKQRQCDPGCDGCRSFLGSNEGALHFLCREGSRPERKVNASFPGVVTQDRTNASLCASESSFSIWLSWGEIFNCVTHKGDRGRMYQGEIAQAGDSIWLPECKIQTRTLRDDQARVIRAEGTSATVGTALLEEPAQRRWGSQWIRTSHA